MCGSSSGPVTPSLSGRTGDPVARSAALRRRSGGSTAESEPERLRLLVGQSRVGPPGVDRLRVDPRPGPRVEAAHDDPVAARIDEREGEALVAAGVLERVEPDEPDPLDRAPSGSLEDGRPRRQVVELARDGVDLVDVGVEDRVEARPVRAAGEPVEPPAQPTETARLNEDENEKHEDGRAEREDRTPEIGRDEGIEIDRSVLRGGRACVRATGRPESSRWPFTADAILRPDPRTASELSRPMAKRSRLTAKPGQRRPLQRSTGPARPVAGITADELARAAELEAAIVAEEKAAEESRRNREKARAAAAVGPSAAYTSVPLAVRAAEEYAYVKRDMRRITVLSGLLLGVLAVLHVLVNVARVITI